MSEIRENKATQEWVIIATERAKRPQDYKGEDTKQNIPNYDPKCPFCPGNEKLAPEPVYEVKSENTWQLRVVPNKFSAVNPNQKKEKIPGPLFNFCTGHGIHDVLIESPKHNDMIINLNEEHMNLLVEAYHKRYETISKDKDIELITIFRNYGLLAGSSLIHPHSQIIATPLIPPTIRTRFLESMRYYDEFSSCMYCDMIKWELSEKIRIIEENEHFVAFVLYAALSPFHTWIIPKRHQASFLEINKNEISSLSSILQIVLKKVYKGLGNPDYNYVIRSAPVGEEGYRHYHWYIALVLRLTKAAGFELGSGMFINPTLPKDNAEFLRNIEI